MKLSVLTILTLMITASYSYANIENEKVKVAVIDTGYTGMFATKELRNSLCKDGHFDVTMNRPVVGYDLIGHGTSFASPRAAGNYVRETYGQD